MVKGWLPTLVQQNIELKIRFQLSQWVKLFSSKKGSHLKNIKVSDKVDTGALAGMTPGMVGADLANLVNEAALFAARAAKRLVEMEEFQ